MALTTEQQAELDFNHANALRHQRLETVRLSKEILIENRRLASGDTADITSSDVTTMATALMSYIES